MSATIKTTPSSKSQIGRRIFDVRYWRLTAISERQNDGCFTPESRRNRQVMISAAFDPGCVKTQMPKSLAQQLNQKCNAYESMLA
jgi:hypothetical protein